jgi:hypothetical protein
MCRSQGRSRLAGRSLTASAVGCCWASCRWSHPSRAGGSLASCRDCSSRDELIERYFEVGVLWRSRVHCAMFRCFPSSMYRRALTTSARKAASRETRNLHKNRALRPFPVGTLLKETNCQRSPRLAATMVSSPLGGTLASSSPVNSTAPLAWTSTTSGVTGCSRAG